MTSDGVTGTPTAGDPTVRVPVNLLGPTIIAPVLLTTAYLLSVFKPPARIRRAPSGGGSPRYRAARSPIGV